MNGDTSADATLWPGRLTREEARQRAGTISDVSYEISMDVTHDGHVRTDTAVRFRADSPDGTVFLDYAGAPEKISVNGAAEPASTRFDGTRITVPVRDGDNEVRVAGTSPYGRSGAGLHRFRDPADGQVYLHTKYQPFDAHRVFPCFDQPDLKATFALVVTAPETWRVVSNTAAERVDRTARATRTWSFARTPLLATYLTALAAGPFEELRVDSKGVPFAVYARASLMEFLAKDAEELASLTARGLDFYADLFGSTYPFGKYDLVFAPEYAFGAMEHPGMVTAAERFVFTSPMPDEARRRRCEVLLHEMAHMWFGNLVTLRWWDDLWLNESFAVWAAAAAQEAVTGFPGAWPTFVHDAAPAARQVDELPGVLPVAFDAADTDAVRRGFNAVTYRKGAVLLRQLEAYTGTDTFLDGIRLYLDRHAWANADRQDFAAALADAGAPEAGDWMRQWFQQPGVATVEVRRNGRRIDVRQRAAPGSPPRAMRLRLGQYPEEAAPPSRAWLELEGDAVVSVDASAARSALVVPNDDGVTYLNLDLDPESRRLLLDRISAIDDSMTRAVAWGALWDDVRHARLRAREFVHCVAWHAPAETAGTTQLLWERACRAAEMYGAHSALDGAHELLASTALAQIRIEPSGEDHRRLWAVLAAATLTADLAAPVAAALLAGATPWPGVAVTTDLRWRLVHRLAVVGRATDELLNLAADADPSWDGHCRLLAARAASPDHAAKEDAWRRMLDRGASMTERRAIMNGLRPPGQQRVLRPYGERYFETLPGVWAADEKEFALAFARLLYPHDAADHGWVKTATDRLLADAATPPELAQILREERARSTAAAAARRRDARISVPA